MYSQESPLNNIQNLQERKAEACKKAKLSPADDSVIDIMEMRNEETNELIFHYLSFYQNSNSFHQLCTDQQMFWNIQQALNKPVNCDDEDSIIAKYEKRTKLSEASDALKRRINALYGEIYKTKEVQDIAVTVVRQMLTPEQRLKQMKDEGLKI